MSSSDKLKRECHADRIRVRGFLREGHTSQLAVLVVEMVSKYVGRVEDISSKADLFNTILLYASPVMFKPALTKLLECLDADEKTYKIAAHRHSAHLVRLLREHHPHLDEHANGCEAFKRSMYCGWSECANVDKQLHSGMILACVKEFLNKTDLAANGYDSILHAMVRADKPVLTLIKKELEKRGTPMEAIAGLLFEKLVRDVRNYIDYAAAGAMRDLIKYGPILSDATVAAAAPSILRRDSLPLIREFCDAYHMQIPPDVVQKAIFDTVCAKPGKMQLKLRSYLIGRFNFDTTSEAYCAATAVRGHVDHLRELLGRGYDPTSPSSTVFMEVCEKASDPRKVALLMDYGCVVTQAHVDAVAGNSSVRVLRLLLKQGEFAITNEHLVRAMRSGAYSSDVVQLMLTKYKLDPSENDNAAWRAGFDTDHGRWLCYPLMVHPRFSFDGLELSNVVKVVLHRVARDDDVLLRITKHFGSDELVAVLMALRLGGSSNYSLRSWRYGLVCKLTGREIVYDGGDSPEFNPTKDSSDGYP